MIYTFEYDEETQAHYISDGTTEQAFDTQDEALIALARWILEDDSTEV